VPLSSRFAYAFLLFFPTTYKYSLAAVAERSPAQRSGAEAAAIHPTLSIGALFHNALNNRGSSCTQVVSDDRFRTAYLRRQPSVSKADVKNTSAVGELDATATRMRSQFGFTDFERALRLS
jgi:hypothetical protein